MHKLVTYCDYFVKLKVNIIVLVGYKLQHLVTGCICPLDKY